MTNPHSTAGHDLVNANRLAWAVASPTNADRMLDFNSITSPASETSLLVCRSVCLMTHSHMSPQEIFTFQEVLPNATWLGRSSPSTPPLFF